MTIKHLFNIGTAQAPSLPNMAQVGFDRVFRPGGQGGGGDVQVAAYTRRKPQQG